MSSNNFLWYLEVVLVCFEADISTKKVDIISTFNKILVIIDNYKAKPMEY